MFLHKLRKRWIRRVFQLYRVSSAYQLFGFCGSNEELPSEVYRRRTILDRLWGGESGAGVLEPHLIHAPGFVEVIVLV